MWRKIQRPRSLIQRRYSTELIRRRLEDEGDWFYSSEWWANESEAQTVFRQHSVNGNGVVSVVASPSSRPGASTILFMKYAGLDIHYQIFQSKVHWPGIEQLLQKRYKDINPDAKHNEDFRVLGYQWRTLQFNEDTQQSTVKIMAFSRESDPGQVCIMQQEHCLAIPYPKSMISAGFSALLSCNYDLESAVLGKKVMNVLCIGHGGGSIPLYLASKIQGANVHIVEIDPVVISASIQAMGFPSFSAMTHSGKRTLSKPDPMSELMWKGVHGRLFLHECDAENFVLDTTDIYDIIFIDAYDGEDIFPHKLWDPHSPFLKSLEKQLHPEHGTVVVNLHADNDVAEYDYRSASSLFDPILPLGKYVSRVCKAYKDVLVRNGSTESGFAFTVNVPWVCNASLVVCRNSANFSGILTRDMVLNRLASKSQEVENILNLPFPCLEYIKRGFILFD